MSSDEDAKLVKSVMDDAMRGALAPLHAALTEDVVIKTIIPEGTPISGDGFRGREGVVRHFKRSAR
jgi:ketosteroid isomerase-like protein